MEKQNQEQAKQEALQLVIICATGIVDAWPTVTLRTLGTVTNKIDTLRQAINEYRKYL